MLRSVPAIPPSPATCPPAVVLRCPNGSLDLYRLRFDGGSGLIRGTASGAWTPEQTDRYIADLDAFVVHSRSAFGLARVLLDRRGVSQQSAEVATRLAEANRRIFDTDDKIALVVDSSLLKTDLRHRMPHPGTKAFLSIDAAETWLKAYSPRA